MNTIVQRYVAGDLPLSMIVKTAPGTRSAIQKALLAILECIEGKRLAKEAIDAAEAVPIEGSDPMLLVLLLASWSRLSCRIARPSQAEALIHRARALLDDSYPPEILAMVMYAESTLDDTTGNKSECERILKDILKTLPSSSPRRKFYVWELAMFLAAQGRGIEFTDEIQGLHMQANENFKAGLVTLARFVNAVETGNIPEAQDLKTRIQEQPEFLKEVPGTPFASYLALMELIREASGGSQQMQRASTGSVTWVKVIIALLRRDPGEALRLARLDANRLSAAVLEGGFTSINLVRTELSAANWEAAKRLIEMRQAKAGSHYLDDIFLTRIALLSGDRQLAALHFAKALESARRHKAMGRFNFELQLACDMTPLDTVELMQAAKTPDGAQTERKPVAQRSRVTSPTGTSRVIGMSQEIKTVCQMLQKLADIDAPVLITGETGTGKDLVARALCEESRRKAKPFLAVNCGAIAETLLESELFGHEKGAFTGAERTNKGLFEEAADGTIFLDEIGDIPPRLQVALLRVMETGDIRAVGSGRTRKIACRILLATNANLKELSDRGTFRKDLLYRLQRLVIHIPPLRERREDIVPLAQFFLDTGRREGIHATLSPEVIETITSYDWPGNVRELRNVIERMRLMHSDKLFYDLHDLDLKFQTSGVFSADNEIRTTALSGEVSSKSRPAAQATTPADSTEKNAGETVDDFLKGGNSQIRRLDRLRALFSQHGKLTRNEIIRLLDISPNTATKDTQALCDEGFVERVEPSKSTRSHYFVLKQKQ